MNFVFYTLLLFCPFVHSLRFYLQPNTKRCLKEEMRKDVVVTGNYSLSDSPGVRTDLLVCIFYAMTLFIIDSIVFLLI